MISGIEKLPNTLSHKALMVADVINCHTGNNHTNLEKASAHMNSYYFLSSS
jgi:hypothetical protein